MTSFCHAESPVNNAASLSSFAWNSLAIMFAFSSNFAAHGNVDVSDATSQNGFAVSPSTFSSLG
jgi:hypothetical protein